MTVVDEIKERIDIVEVIGETVKLRKSGKNYSGFCPFHPNTRTPSFAVFPESGTWRCFGACNEGGDVFNFLMKKNNWDFPEALSYLAQRAGVVLKPRTPEESEREKAYERLRELLEAVVVFYRHQLMKSESGEPALDYLRSRGLSDETLEAFEIGYAPDSWDATMKHLTGRGWSTDDLADAGLLSERESGGWYDRFRGRIMFPIRDARGRLSGFGARVLDPEGVPKYLNSPQTALFDKGRLLYGLDKARAAIRKADQAVIVEGYMDVIGLHQAGYTNAVSPMGTALSEHQLRMLKRYTRNIILALDPDAAGSQATLRGLDVAREVLDREADPVFNARGLVRQEGRLDANLRIVTLPEDKDPDEVVLEDADAWPALLGGAQTIVEYVLDVTASQFDLDDPKAKAQVARRVMPLIEDVADPVEREAYRQSLARRLRVDERALLEWRPARGKRRPTPSRPPREERPAEAAESALEGFCLGVLLQQPQRLYRINRAFQSLELDKLSAQDFTGAERQVIFQSLQAALAQDASDPEEHWRSQIGAALLPVAKAYIEIAGDIEIELPRVLTDVVNQFLRLRKRNLDLELSELRFQMMAMQEPEDGDSDAAQKEVWDQARRVQSLAVQKERLDRALSGRHGPLTLESLS